MWRLVETKTDKPQFFLQVTHSVHQEVSTTDNRQKNFLLSVHRVDKLPCITISETSDEDY